MAGPSLTLARDADGTSIARVPRATNSIQSAPICLHPLRRYCERLRPAHFAMLRFGFRRVLTAREAAPLPPQPNARLTNPQIEAVRSRASVCVTDLSALSAEPTLRGHRKPPSRGAGRSKTLAEKGLRSPALANFQREGNPNLSLPAAQSGGWVPLAHHLPSRATNP